LLCALLAGAAPIAASAQGVDTLRADTTAERLGLWTRTSRSSGLMLTTGKTYNRVEGLPVYLGPMFHDSIGAADINASMMGIIRSADTFHWDSQNLGHRIAAEARVGRGRGYGLAVSSYDVMTPVEAWQLPDPDAGLAAFFGHRDFRHVRFALNAHLPIAFYVRQSNQLWVVDRGGEAQILLQIMGADVVTRHDMLIRPSVRDQALGSAF
jgi:hypothetical protein